MYSCPYCENTFTEKFNMNRHVKSSIRCIKTRANIPETNTKEILSCDCGYSVSRKDMLIRHKANCVFLKMTLTIERQINTIKSHVESIENCERTIEDRNSIITDLKEQVKLLISRPININNNQTINNNQQQQTYNIQFYKQHIQDNFESLTQSFLQGVMNKITLDDISYGGSGLAKFVKKHLDHQHLLMLDQARRKGAYKDANGQVVVDSKLRSLLQMIGEAGYPPAKKIFIDWNAENPDSFLNSSKSKTLTSLMGATGWLNRVGDGKTDEDDSEILSSFVDELASGYTKEALHNHLEKQSEPPLIDEDEKPEEPEVETKRPIGDESDVSSDWPEIYEEPESEEEYETEVETESITSSQFDVIIGTKNYETCLMRGTRDEDNLYQNFKPQSKYAITN
jgi:hypothetical protein